MSHRYGKFLVGEEILRIAYAPHKCSCGANATSNPNLHADWCDLTVKHIHALKVFLSDAMIVRAEFLYTSRDIEYMAEHPSFDEIPVGSSAPTYRLTIKDGNVIIGKEDG